ncbi:MAG: tripartite tricarboxylate transporter TctB family protein [Deltaproteobacteria bacterium]|nr:tripartite tricarboxylate transporter TctB family protein [Deltaproteobacteria bacterium]
MSELKSGLFFFGLSLFIIWEAQRVRLGTLRLPGPGFLPFCAGTVLIALSVVLIRRGSGARESPKSHPARVIVALASLFAYSLVLEPLGFVVATFFLVGILFHLGKPRPWWMLLGMTALVTFLSYFVFGRLLHVYFPRGFLGV